MVTEQINQWVGVVFTNLILKNQKQNGYQMGPTHPNTQ